MSEPPHPQSRVGLGPQPLSLLSDPRASSSSPRRRIMSRAARHSERRPEMKSGWEGRRDADPRTRDKPVIAVPLLPPPGLPPSLLTSPLGPGRDNHSPLLSSDTPASGHYCSHFTGGDTETRGKATPGLCPGVGPQADPCRSPVPFTPQCPSPQPPSSPGGQGGLQRL